MRKTRSSYIKNIVSLRSMVVVAAVLLSSLLVFNIVSADGGAGGGGDGGGGRCNSSGSGPVGAFCPVSGGVRWKKYNPSDAGPNCGFKIDDISRHGTGCSLYPGSRPSETWNNTIKQTCLIKGYSVYVFEIGNGAGEYMGYNFNRKNIGNSLYDANKDPAESLFNQTSGLFSHAGLRFGGRDGNVSWFCYDDKFSMNPTISIYPSSAQPGDTVRWDYTVKNTKGALSPAVRYGWTPSTTGALNQKGSKQFAGNETVSWSDTITIGPGDVGKRICRRTYATPHSTSDSGTIRSNEACVTVAQGYDLKPTLSNPSPQSVTVAGGDVTVPGSVNNSGTTSSPTTTVWQFTRFIIRPGGATPSFAPGNGPSAQPPCGYVGSKATDVSACSALTGSGATGNRDFPRGDTTIILSDNLGAYPIGSKICYVLSVAPRSSNTTNERAYSGPQCIAVSKSPLLQISGGDVVVGRGGMGNDSNPTATISVNRFVGPASDGKTYGSWSEFAAMAPDSSNIATGGALATQDNRSTTTTKALTFANNGTNEGNFGDTGNATDMYNTYSSAPVGYTQHTFAANATITVPSTGKHYYTVTNSDATLTINGGTVPQGVSIIIHSMGPVRINGNITYSNDPYTGVGQLPQMIITTNNTILIDPAVTQIDSWLYAGGSDADGAVINTCSLDGASVINSSYTIGLSASSTNRCNQNSLVVNGPIGTTHLQLRRTAGSDGATDSTLSKSAESFNLRPDAFLWQVGQSVSSGPVTVYTQEIAPRY